MRPIEILYEDNHLLVINKPADLATMGAEGGPTVHSLAADYLKRTYGKPGNVYVGVVSRLDAMTSGVLVLARTSKGAARLSAQFADRGAAGPIKLYLAAVEGHWAEPQGELDDHVLKDDARHRMRVVASSTAGAKQARLRYARLMANDRASVIAIRLLTGRKHQIRLQFAERGHPVLGDRKYGATSRFSFDTPLKGGIALHSWRLRIMHPTKRIPLWFEAPPPKSWRPLLGSPDLSAAQLTKIEQVLLLDMGG